MKVVVVDGRIVVVAHATTDEHWKLLFGEGVQIERQGRVVPDNPVLRSLFKMIRAVSRDNGKLAEFTRRWPCRWRVEVDGRVLRVYHKRSDAIRAEEEYVVQKLKRDSSRFSILVTEDLPASTDR